MMHVLSDSGGKAGANPRRQARRWLRPSADRLSRHQPALLSPDRIFPGLDTSYQRERAGGLPTPGSTRLLSAHQDGCVGDRRRCHVASMRGARDWHRSTRRRFWPIATARKSMPGGTDHVHDRGGARSGRDYAQRWCFEAISTHADTSNAVTSNIHRLLLRCPGGDQDHALYLFTPTFNRI